MEKKGGGGGSGKGGGGYIVLLQSWLSPHAQSECLGQASSSNICFLTFTKSFCFLFKIILGGKKMYPVYLSVPMCCWSLILMN